MRAEKNKTSFTINCNSSYKLLISATNFENNTLEFTSDAKKDSKTEAPAEKK